MTNNQSWIIFRTECRIVLIRMKSIQNVIDAFNNSVLCWVGSYSFKILRACKIALCK